MYIEHLYNALQLGIFLKNFNLWKANLENVDLLVT